MNTTGRPSRDESNDRGRSNYRRRRFLALGTSVAATALAGCSAESAPDGADGGGTPAGGSNGPNTPSETSAHSGRFRLLISDRPADIGDFDSLEVSFDRARILEAEDGSGARGESPTASPSEPVSTEESATTSESASTTVSTNATDAPPETPSPTSATTAAEDGEDVESKQANEGSQEGEDGGDERRGFLTLDLGGATVDLTRVVGEKAIGIGEEDVPEGRYAKIELYAAGVEGIVDGDPVEVKIPSGKLQIVKPFVVERGKTVSFVFDINVVKKGRSDRYNLLPVIAESGVAGKDVDVDEVETGGRRDATRTESGTPGGTTDDRGGDGNAGNDPGEAGSNGPPEDGG